MTNSAHSLGRRQVLLAGAGLCAAGLACAEAWSPTHPIKLVVTYPPGGGADVTARAFVEQLGQKLGQPVVVDNRGGAGGAIGAEVVYRAAPDGYTLLWGNADIMTIAPHLFNKLAYKPMEFVPIGPTAAVAFVLVGRNSLEARTFPELLELARRKELTFASWGNGSPGHVGSEMFKTLGKVPATLTVPYQGTAPAAQALLAGQVDMMYLPSPLFLAMESRVTTFAAAGKKRYDRFKHVPTMAEFGVPVDLEVWQGLFAPPGTPGPVIERFAKALAEVSADPAIRKKIEELGVVPLAGSQEDFARSIAPDAARWGEIMRTAQVRPQG
ncbi:Bug family tripartite tricarboxylate transporter substrate binding protein [Variovorax sp. RA8]|uniref:Bug family tripartite tricarboxylate transporter substrate binding protein n=1 Tax=Variovorax sp. (strain JCM 16519 / RA8) TaxID=662548 RepID=UPI001315D199|nr:tripartite tricarboxylate transporter substrate binding protein [Variovorax sp. RA8]VTU42006.1 Argininosuccinate lyase [Variovorax sp. RA8]